MIHQVFRHGHEVMEGRTSSVARHTLGFLPDGGVVNYRTADAPGALRCVCDLSSVAL